MESAFIWSPIPSAGDDHVPPSFLLLWLPLSTVLQAAVFKCLRPSGSTVSGPSLSGGSSGPYPAAGYFSQISREPYQREAVKLQKGSAGQEGSCSASSAQQLRQRQRSRR
jgi:hypothetical protein